MWKLKLDDKGNVVVQDGKPVYVKDDGTEMVFDYADTVKRLNGEATGARKQKEAAEAELAKFKDIDPEKARDAIDKLSRIDQSKLIESGKLDEVKTQMTAAFQKQITDKEKAFADLQAKHHNTIKENAFAKSNFITEKMIVPPSMAQKIFGDAFKVEENGSLVAIDPKTNQPMLSDINPGSVADFNEALANLVKASPDGARIMKGNGQSGSGSPGSNGGANGKREIRATDFAKMNGGQKVAAQTEIQAGKAVMVD